MINVHKFSSGVKSRYKFGHLLHVGCFADVFTFESWLPRTIRFWVQYFFDVGLQLVTFGSRPVFFFNLCTYGNLVAEENMRSSELLVML